MNKSTLIGLAVVAVIAIGGYFAPRAVKEFGATPGADQQGPCVTIGGLERCYYRASFSTASSTYCAFRLPSASSTLVSFNARLDTSTTSGTYLVLATSTAGFAPQSVGGATTSEISSLTVAGATKPNFYVVPGTGAVGLAASLNATSTLQTTLSSTSTTNRDVFLVLYVRGGGTGGVVDDTLLKAQHTGVCEAITQTQ